ncbi:MAG: hypothetical protein ABI639_15700 [Thermoanaerobaculia bacterium]
MIEGLPMRFVAAGFAVTLLGLFAPSDLAGQMRSTRLSEPGVPGNDVAAGAALSPDGKWVVYRQDPVVPGALELFSVARSGGEPVRLSFALPAGVSVVFFRITPDSERVVYLAAQETAGVVEIWSVPIAGPAAAAVKLNPTSIASGDVVDFAISPDSTSVVFRGDLLTDGTFELWSAPILGPAALATHLHPAPVAGGHITLYRIAPDSSRVVFTGDLLFDERFEIFSVPIAGPFTSVVVLNPLPVASGDVEDHDIFIDSGSARVLFIGDLETDGVSELWSAAIAGPGRAAIRLNPLATAGGDVPPSPFQSVAISPDGQFAVFYGDLSTDDVFELWSVPIAGPASQAVKLNPPPVSGGDVETFNLNPPFRITSDSARVLFFGDLLTDSISEVWSVPISGPAADAIALSLPAAVPSGVSTQPWSLSSDGARVLFSGVFSGGNRKIWTARTDGPARSAVNVCGNTSFNQHLEAYEFAADASRIFFRANLDRASQDWLYTTPADGFGGRVALTADFDAVRGSNVSQYAASPDGSVVVYRADRDAEDTFELFEVSTAGGPASRISPALPAGRDVLALESVFTTMGSGALLFEANVTSLDSAELWIADSRILLAGFETGDAAEWSVSVP